MTRKFAGVNYIHFYETPEGFSDIVMGSDGTALTGLWFLADGEAESFAQAYPQKDLPVFTETESWLDIYFEGRDPGFLPEYKLYEVSSFQKEVYAIMNKIPYGQTMTYGQIAKMIAKNRDVEKMSAQAVGGAVGKNPISIILPCHRVVGAGGTMTGYGGGIMNKVALLSLEWIAHSPGQK